MTYTCYGEWAWLASWLGIYVYAQYIQFIHSWVHLNLLLLHPFLLVKSSFASCGLLLLIIQIWYLHMLKFHLLTMQDINWFTMALTFNNDHIIYYHMDATWSTSFVWIYSLILTIWWSNAGSAPPIYFLIQLT